MRKLLSLLVAIPVLASFVFAQTQVDPMNLPKLTQWVTDFSHTLSTSQLSDLNASAKDYETQTSSQLVAVLFPNRNGNELIDIGMKVFTDNGIGQKDKNNGLLLLISTDEKKIRIVVGYGLEGAYPDLMASQVIENDIRPLVNSGDFAGAVKVFYERSEQILSGEIPVGYSTTASSSTTSSDSNFWIVIVGFFIGVALRNIFKKKLKSKKDKNTLKVIVSVIGSIFIFLFFIFSAAFVGLIIMLLIVGIIFGFIGFLGGIGGGGGGGFGGGGFGGGGFGGGGGGSGGGGAGD